MIGYAHVTVNPMEMLYTISDFEKDTLPLPDFIAVNGIRSKEVLIKSGFPADRIQVIGSLRYENVKLPFKAREFHNDKIILVVLSADINRSLEMIIKSLIAFTGLEGVSVLLKPHPTMKLSFLEQYLRQLPENFSITNKSISQSLPAIDIMIYNDSTAAVEAAINAIPLIHMKSDYSIDIDPFGGINLVPSAGSPEGLREIALGIIQGKKELTHNISVTAEEFFFEPVHLDRLEQLLSK
jgi:surface carbohydrate biosynthesis protein (TIGR04326 family)